MKLRAALLTLLILCRCGEPCYAQTLTTGAGSGGLPRNTLQTIANAWGSWSGAGAGLTVNQNNTASPDGATNAAQILDTATTATHNLDSGSFSGILANVTATGSLFVKQSTGRFLTLAVDNGAAGSGFGIAVDTQLGTITQTANTFGTGTYTSSKIVALPNSWYYVSLAGKVDATSTTARLFICLANSGTPGTTCQSYLGTGIGIFIYNGRISVGAN